MGTHVHILTKIYSAAGVFFHQKQKAAFLCIILIFIDHVYIHLSSLHVCVDGYESPSNTSICMGEAASGSSTSGTSQKSRRECNFLPKSNFYGRCCRHISVVFVQKCDIIKYPFLGF